MLELFKQYWKAAAMIAMFAGYSGYIFYVGTVYESAAWERKENEQLKANQAALKLLQGAANAKSEALEKILAELRKVNREINGRLRAELQKNVAYRDCIVPDDGLRILNEAATAGGIHAP